jgi:hypothetical protein
MEQKFPRTLAAVKKGENSLWDLGNALDQGQPMNRYR